MKSSIIVSIVLAIAAVGGSAYYVIHQHQITVEIPSSQKPSDWEKVGQRAKEEIGTYKDAKHPSFPGEVEQRN